MSSPLISVVMSAYNAERYVEEAVRSILTQTLGDFEFIIFDDGSTDGSRKILEGLASEDRRIRLTSRANKGLTVTLNEALAQANGEFIARMDCDDVAMPERFSHQIEALRADPSLVCVGGWFQLIDGEGRLLTVLRVPTSDASIQRDALRGHGSICHPTAMIRRDALQRINGYDERFRTSQDLDLWLRLGEIGKLANVPRTVLKFRLHESSVSETKRTEQRRAGRMACELAWQRRGITDGVFEAEEPWRPGKDAESRLKFALQYGWWAFRSGERRTALHYAMRAIRARPICPDGWKLALAAAVKPVPPRVAATEA